MIARLGAFGREFLGLFVEDGSLALSLLAWVAIVTAIAHFGLNRHLAGAIFVLGCLLILIENVRRGARRQAAARLDKRPLQGAGKFP